MILGHYLKIGQSLQYVTFLIKPFFGDTGMNILLKYEPNIILWISLAVSNKIKVVYPCDEICFKVLELIVYFLF